MSSGTGVREIKPVFRNELARRFSELAKTMNVELKFKTNPINDKELIWARNVVKHLLCGYHSWWVLDRWARGSGFMTQGHKYDGYPWTKKQLIETDGRFEHNPKFVGLENNYPKEKYPKAYAVIKSFEPNRGKNG